MFFGPDLEIHLEIKADSLGSFYLSADSLSRRYVWTAQDYYAQNQFINSLKQTIMIRLLVVLVVVTGVWSCDLGVTEVTENPQSPDALISLRARDCDVGDNWIGRTWDLGSCKKNCERGIGFRCGGSRDFCNNGVLTQIPIPPSERCLDKWSLGSAPGSHTYTSLPDLSGDPTRQVDLVIEVVSASVARITFLTSLPSGELEEYPYLVVDDSGIRWEHPNRLDIRWSNL